jgi:hypothetical protein
MNVFHMRPLESMGKKMGSDLIKKHTIREDIECFFNKKMNMFILI